MLNPKEHHPFIHPFIRSSIHPPIHSPSGLMLGIQWSDLRNWLEKMFKRLKEKSRVPSNSTAVQHLVCKNQPETIGHICVAINIR